MIIKHLQYAKLCMKQQRPLIPGDQHSLWKTLNKQLLYNQVGGSGKLLENFEKKKR